MAGHNHIDASTEASMDGKAFIYGLRERAISRIEAGGSVRAVAASLSISLRGEMVATISGDGQRRAGKDGRS